MEILARQSTAETAQALCKCTETKLTDHLGYLNLQALMERGILSQAEYTDLEPAFLDPSFSFITLTKFAAWGKRAS